jgi:hypothetical protein
MSRFGHQLRLLKVQAGYREYSDVDLKVKPSSVEHSPLAAHVPHTMEIHIVVAAGERMTLFSLHYFTLMYMLVHNTREILCANSCISKCNIINR